MIPLEDADLVASPVEGEGVVMGRRKLFGYGSRWHCWRIRRRRDAPGGYAALVEKMPWPRHAPRHAARERIDA